MSFGASLLLQRKRDALHARALDRALDQRSANASPSGTAEARPWWRSGLAWLEALGHRFESGGLGRILLASEDRLLLDQINANTFSGRAVFLGMRLALALALPILAVAWLHPTGVRAAITLLAGFGLGVLLPKFGLDAWAKRLRRRVEDELPLLIDLLRLLQGVGFSIDQSLQMIDERFGVIVPLLGREIHAANTAYIHGRGRAQSLRRLSEAFGNEDLKSLVQIIVQVHEHGGVVQEPLRQFAERLREQRRMAMKEKIGKLSVKMTLVMMLTLLPALMLVLAGPAAISLIDTMVKLKGHGP